MQINVLLNIILYFIRTLVHYGLLYRTESHPSSCKMGTGSFPGVKYGWGVLLTTHPLLVPWSCKSRAIPLSTLWATSGPVRETLYHYLLYPHRLLGSQLPGLIK